MLLALDFGGTKLAAAICSSEQAAIARQWQAQRRVLSPSRPTAQTDLDMMRSLIHDLLNGASPTAIGVSFGGPADFVSGVVRLSHHVAGWDNIPLQLLLESEFQAPTRIDNDANVAALGEYRFGAGQGAESMFYITVSTGVGGGWILNGRPWRGATGLAGELGHMVVDPQGPMCLCGKRGCVERLASGPYLAQDAKEQLQLPRRGQILRSLVPTPDLVTAQHISEAASQGDALSQQLLERAGRALGMGIGNVANVMNPQRFILGGGVTKAGEFFWQTIRQAAQTTALPEVPLEIQPAALGDDAPLWGAIALAAEIDRSVHD